MAQFDQRNQQLINNPALNPAQSRSSDLNQLHPAVASTESADVTLKSKLPERTVTGAETKAINNDSIRDVVQEVAGVGKGFRNGTSRTVARQNELNNDPVSAKLQRGEALTQQARELGTNNTTAAERSVEREGAKTEDRTTQKQQTENQQRSRAVDEHRIEVSRVQQNKSASQLELGNIARLRDRLTTRAIELTRESASLQDRTKESANRAELRRITAELSDLKLQHERIVELQREATNINPADLTRQVTSQRVQQFQLGAAALLASAQLRTEAKLEAVGTNTSPLDRRETLSNAAGTKGALQQGDSSTVLGGLANHRKADSDTAFERLQIDSRFWQQQAEREQLRGQLNRQQLEREQREQRRETNEREYGLRYEEELKTVHTQRRDRELRLGLKQWIITRYGARGKPMRNDARRLNKIQEDGSKMNVVSMKRAFIFLVVMAIALILISLR